MSVPDRLTITSRAGLGIASVMARKRVDASAIGAALGAAMPCGPHATFAGARTVLGTGPGTWLVFEEAAAPDFAETIAQALSSLASVSDQTSGYVVQRLAGPDACGLLQRGAAIDLHPDVFRAGTAAATVIAHIGVTLWQVDDRPTYDVATFRSYGGCFRHWLELTAATL